MVQATSALSTTSAPMPIVSAAMCVPTTAVNAVNVAKTFVNAIPASRLFLFLFFLKKKRFLIIDCEHSGTACNQYTSTLESIAVPPLASRFSFLTQVTFFFLF